MSIKQQREAAIDEMLAQLRPILDDGATVDRLEQAKPLLMSLCSRSELFPRTDFPLPQGDATDRTFLIHEDDDGGYALYVNSGVPGQHYRPHDHGGAWALVAAVSGSEKHRLYLRRDDGARPGFAELEQVGEIDVQPGTAVSLLEAGIHAIEALGSEPLLHLHLYAKGFPHQSIRTEYDLETGRAFTTRGEISFAIEDAR